MNTVSAKIMLMNGDLDEKLAYLYACPIEAAALHRERLINAIEKFEELFGVSGKSLFSALPEERKSAETTPTISWAGCWPPV